MNRLTRDGFAETVSRDQILRRERGQGNIIFPDQLTTSRIGNLTRLIDNLAICDDPYFSTMCGLALRNLDLLIKTGWSVICPVCC